MSNDTNSSEENDEIDNLGIINLRRDIEKAIDYSIVENYLSYEEIIGTLEMLKQRLCIDYQMRLDKFNSNKEEEE